MSETLAPEQRFLLYHKHHASARTRFLCLDNRSVLYPAPLPAIAPPCDRDLATPLQGEVAPHPTLLLQPLAAGLGIAPAQLELELHFDERFTTLDALITVYLVRFTAIDPPFALAGQLQADFIDLTQARHLPAIELRLLRHAYELIMEG